MGKLWRDLRELADGFQFEFSVASLCHEQKA